MAVGAAYVTLRHFCDHHVQRNAPAHEERNTAPTLFSLSVIELEDDRIFLSAVNTGVFAKVVPDEFSVDRVRGQPLPPHPIGFFAPTVLQDLSAARETPVANALGKATVRCKRSKRLFPIARATDLRFADRRSVALTSLASRIEPRRVRSFPREELRELPLVAACAEELLVHARSLDVVEARDKTSDRRYSESIMRPVVQPWRICSTVNGMSERSLSSLEEPAGGRRPNSTELWGCPFSVPPSHHRPGSALFEGPGVSTQRGAIGAVPSL